MCWLYKNIFFFLKNQNFYVSNFFLLHHFNSYSILIKNNFSKTYFISFNSNFNKNIIINSTNSFLFKYFKYFNKTVFFKNNSIKLNQLNYYSNNDNYNYYYFNNYNFFFYKKLVNLILQINMENRNFIILDKSYKNIFPLYNYIFNYKNLIIYKKYFFINSKYFTYNNWHYFYSKFAEKFKIILIMIFDFYHFNKFFKSLKSINLPIASLIPINNQNDFVDYPIFMPYYYNFEKFIFLNLVTQSILVSYNYKFYYNKIKFLKIFYNFSLKFDYLQ